MCLSIHPILISAVFQLINKHWSDDTINVNEKLIALPDMAIIDVIGRAELIPGSADGVIWKPGVTPVQRINIHSRFTSQVLSTTGVSMKSFIAKRVNSILVNLRYLRFKLLKYKENNKKICNTFDHDFKNIPLYIYKDKGIIRKVLFCIIQCALILKMSKMALNPFCDKTLDIFTHKSTVMCPVSVQCEDVGTLPGRKERTMIYIFN